MDTILWNRMVKPMLGSTFPLLSIPQSDSPKLSPSREPEMDLGTQDQGPGLLRRRPNNCREPSGICRAKFFGNHFKTCPNLMMVGQIFFSIMKQLCVLSLNEELFLATLRTKLHSNQETVAQSAIFWLKTAASAVAHKAASHFPTPWAHSIQNHTLTFISHCCEHHFMFSWDMQHHSNLVWTSLLFMHALDFRYPRNSSGFLKLYSRWVAQRFGLGGKPSRAAWRRRTHT